MRLTCPNCGAEYEVPDGLVPEGGRHVQCTDCDTRWFVRGGRDAVVSEDQLIERLENWRPRLVTGGTSRNAEPAAPAAREASPPEASSPTPWREAEPKPEPDPERIAVASDHVEEVAEAAPPADLARDEPPEDFVWEDSGGAVAPPEPATPVRPPTRPTPPAAAPMFRPVRTPEPEAASAPSPEPAARTDPDPPASEDVVSEADKFEADAGEGDRRPARGRRRNSQRIELPEGGTGDVETALPEADPGRFRAGVLTAVALCALALAVYVARDPIIRTVPAVEPALSAYGGAVDGLRDRIDGIVAPDG